MEYSEDHIALAAEYALGTLDADERAQVETMMAPTTSSPAIVHAWEFRLGVLNQMVGSVEPPPELWERIRTAIGLTGQPQAPLRAAGDAAADCAIVCRDRGFRMAATSRIRRRPRRRRLPSPTSNVVQLAGRVRAYRNIAHGDDRDCSSAARDDRRASRLSGLVAGAWRKAGHAGGRGHADA